MVYACDRCGTLRADGGDCQACGGSVSEYDVGGGGEVYVCDECGDSFDTQRGLSAHARVHEDDEGDEE